MDWLVCVAQPSRLAKSVMLLYEFSVIYLVPPLAHQDQLLFAAGGFLFSQGYPILSHVLLSRRLCQQNVVNVCRLRTYNGKCSCWMETARPYRAVTMLAVTMLVDNQSTMY